VLDGNRSASRFESTLIPVTPSTLYGKRRPTLQLGMYASPDYTYHDESPEGRDIYKVGDAIGIGFGCGRS